MIIEWNKEERNERWMLQMNKKMTRKNMMRILLFTFQHVLIHQGE